MRYRPFAGSSLMSEIMIGKLSVAIVDTKYAALFSASSDLMKALEDLVDYIIKREGRIDESDAILLAAAEAITKATGKKRYLCPSSQTTNQRRNTMFRILKPLNRRRYPVQELSQENFSSLKKARFAILESFTLQDTREGGKFWWSVIHRLQAMEAGERP